MDPDHYAAIGFGTAAALMMVPSTIHKIRNHIRKNKIQENTK